MKILPYSPEIKDKELRKKALELYMLQRRIFSNLKINKSKTLFSGFSLFQDKNRLSILLDFPLFYEEDIFVQLSSYKLPGNIENQLHIKTPYILSIDVFSDNDYLDSIRKYANSNQLVEVNFYFEENGEAYKVLDVPDEIQISRESLLPGQNIYLSEITHEDIKYAERALQVMLHIVEDYNKVHKK